MWLLLSTAAGVPPTVGPDFSFTHPFSDRHIFSQVLLSLNLNGIVALFSTRDVDFT